jgi:hypothetical protein
MFRGHRRVDGLVSRSAPRQIEVLGSSNASPRRRAAAILGGTMVLALQWVTAAPASADPGGAVKPKQQQAYAAPTATPRQDKVAEVPQPLSAADKRPTRPAPQSGGPSVDVVGGTAASVGEYPYFASVWRLGIPICGGSLMSTGMVLTAANCINNADPLSYYQVRIGGTQLTGGTDTGVLRGIALVNKHPSWIAPISPVNPTPYDVAILTLSSPITRADATVQWLRLAQGNELGLVDPGDSGTLLGHGSPSPPPVGPLMELPEALRADSAVPIPGFIPALMLGAGGTATGGQGACRADQGGPLVITSTPLDVQIGNLSWFTALQSPGSRPGSTAWSTPPGRATTSSLALSR